MDKISGISANTARRLLLDSGAVYINYGLGSQRLIGATKGGNSFELNAEYREMEVDGSPGPVKGFERLVRCAPVLKINLLEHTTTELLDILPGAVNNATGTHDVLTRLAQVVDGDYITNVTLILKKQGTAEYFGFKVSNALSKGSFTFSASENDEGVIAVEYHAHYAATDLATEPWEIFNPLEAAGGFWTLTYTAGANGTIIGTSPQTVQDGGDGGAVIAIADDGYNFDAWSDAYSKPVGAPDEAGWRRDLAVSGNVTVSASFVAE